jgi:hypothetical protein
MALTDAVDQYCERLGPGLLAEPLNALSNAAFLLAAYGLWRVYRRLGRRQREHEALIALVAVVGVGSATFHTVATVWAMACDVVPIIVALVWFLWVFLRRVARCDARGTALWLGAFGAVSGLFTVLVPRDLVNGSQSYFSCVVALIVIGRYLRRTASPVAGSFSAAAAIFAVSLSCRSFDMAVCPALPIGTHFLWHTLNGVTLYLAGRGLFIEEARRCTS